MTDHARIERFVSEVGRVFYAPAAKATHVSDLTKQEVNMTEYDNTNRGVLFSERDKKTKNDDRDYSGSINIEGTEYWLSGWVKTSKKTGAKFLSLSVKSKEERTASAGGSRKRDVDDEISF